MLCGRLFTWDNDADALFQFRRDVASLVVDAGQDFSAVSSQLELGDQPLDSGR